MVEGRIVDLVRIAPPVSVGEQRGQDHHRHDDEQHDAGREQDQIPLLDRDVARREHLNHVAAAEQDRQRDYRESDGPRDGAGSWAGHAPRIAASTSADFDPDQITRDRSPLSRPGCPAYAQARRSMHARGSSDLWTGTNGSDDRW